MLGLITKVKIFQKYFLFVLFVGYYASITLFYHSHIINGIRISHSHVQFSQTDSEGLPLKQSHSENELELIQLISHFLTTPVAVSFSLRQILVLENQYLIPGEVTAITDLRQKELHLRGPPSNSIAA